MLAAGIGAFLGHGSQQGATPKQAEHLVAEETELELGHVRGKVAISV